MILIKMKSIVHSSWMPIVKFVVLLHSSAYLSDHKLRKNVIPG